MNYIVLPILIPLLFLIIFIFLKNIRLIHLFSALGALINLVVAIFILIKLNTHKIISLQVGGWKAPYGITLVVDYLSALMLIISGIIILATVLSSHKQILVKQKIRQFYVFIFALIMGVNGAFITGDAFNLYVWFEVILLSSFVLITIGNTSYQLEGGIKYMALNLLGSLFFLAGLGVLYGKTGTLNMAHLANIIRHTDQNILLNTSGILFFVAFGLKAAVFPLFFWLPASYHTANIAVSSLFSGILTKVGVYALIRFFTLFYIHEGEFWLNFMLIIASLTMITGGMAASTYYDIRKILSYHIISQIGYMILGLGIFTPLAIAGSVYFMLHNMIAKTNTFVVAGLIAKVNGTYDLNKTGGIIKKYPLLAISFLIPAFALAGIPPLSGFFAKFILLKGGFEAHQFLATSIAVFTSILTLYSMVKIWNKAILRDVPEGESQPTIKLTFVDYIPTIILGLVSICMGLFAKQMLDFSMQAAEQMINPENYIHTILK